MTDNNRDMEKVETIGPSAPRDGDDGFVYFHGHTAVRKGALTDEQLEQLKKELCEAMNEVRLKFARLEKR